jgi:hypothetical protein
MKQILLVAASLALMCGCSQSIPSSGVSQADQNSSEEFVPPENTETVVFNVPMS